MSRTTFTILTAGLLVAACSQASEQRGSSNRGKSGAISTGIANVAATLLMKS